MDAGSGNTEVEQFREAVMSDSVIEKGVPIPTKGIRKPEDKYPELLVLNVGDSFVVHNAPIGTHVLVALFGIENDQRHEVRKISGDDFRIWRTR